MKTNGVTWKAYLESWPQGQWYDYCNELINGIPSDEFTGIIPDDAVVDFTEGVIFTNENDRTGSYIVQHFKRWIAEQTTTFITVQIPKEHLQQLTETITALGGKVLK